MTPCESKQDQLLEWVDRRLSLAEQHRLDEHLQQCERCRQTLLALQEAKRALQRVPAAAIPPEDWQERLYSRLRATCQGHRRQRFLTSVLAAAALTLLMVMAFHYVTRPTPPPPLPIESLAQDLRATRLNPKEAPLPDPYGLTGWLQAQMASLPETKRPPLLPVQLVQVGSYRLDQAGILDLKGSRAPRLVYRTPRGPLNLYWLPGAWSLERLSIPPAPSAGCRPRLYQGEDFTLVAWQNGVFLCVLISRDLPAKELITLSDQLDHSCR